MTLVETPVLLGGPLKMILIRRYVTTLIELKRIVIVKAILCCAACALLQIVLGCSFLHLSVPFGLREKSVIAGTGFLSRSVFLVHSAEDRQKKMNYVTAIQESQIVRGRVSQLAIFDQGRLFFVDPHTHTAKWRLNYKDAGYLSRPLLVDVDGDGTREIVCRGGGFSDVGLLDSAGKLLWKKSGSYTTESTANSMSVGDLDRDGAMEFYVAATDGLYSFAVDGSRIWRIGGENEVYWAVELFDSEVASERLIVANVQHRGRHQPRFLEFRDLQGNLMRRIRPARHINSFRVLRWPIGAKSLRILGRSGSALVILDGDGEVVWEYKIPWKLSTGIGVEGTFVRFSNQEEPYLAVLLGTRASWRRSVLCLFSLDGNLVYQEILGQTEGLLAVRLEGASSPGDVLLVGDGIGKVVAYQRSRTPE